MCRNCREKTVYNTHEVKKLQKLTLKVLSESRHVRTEYGRITRNSKVNRHDNLNDHDLDSFVFVKRILTIIVL